MEHSSGSSRLLRRLEDRTQNLALLCAVPQSERLHGAMLPSGELGSQPKMAAYARTVSHRGKKLILGDTVRFTERAFPLLAPIHRLFHFLHTCTDFSTFSFLL